MTGNISMGGNRVTGLAAAASNGDAARFQQLESQMHMRVHRGGDTMYGNLVMGAGDTVDGVDVSEISGGGALMLSGEYTGDGADDRSINVGVNLSTVSQYFIFIKADGAQVGVWRNSALTGDSTDRFDNGLRGVNMIQAVNATGFQIGTDVVVNECGTVYAYEVWYLV